MVVLNRKDVRDALVEFDRLVLEEAQSARWDADLHGERTALVAARAVLAQLDGYMVDRLAEIDADLREPVRDD